MPLFQFIWPTVWQGPPDPWHQFCSMRNWDHFTLRQIILCLDKWMTLWLLTCCWTTGACHLNIQSVCKGSKRWWIYHFPGSYVPVINYSLTVRNLCPIFSLHFSTLHFQSIDLVGPFSDTVKGLLIARLSTSGALKTDLFLWGPKLIESFKFLVRRRVFQNLSNFWSVLKCEFQSWTHCTGFLPNNVWRQYCYV